MEATILTKRNAHRAAVVRQIANPEYGDWRWQWRGQPLNKGFFGCTSWAHVAGEGSNSVVVGDSELHFWEVVSWKYKINLEELWDTACRAFNGTSFSPEERGAHYIRSYEEALNSDLENIPQEEQEQYIAKFKEWVRTLFDKHSRCLSSMITGPANFPTRRNEKANNSYENAVKEFGEWREKAQKAIARRIEEAKPAEQKAEEQWEAVKLEIDTVYITQLLYGKLERIALKGEVELMQKSIDYVRELNAQRKKPIFTERHKFFKLAQLAELWRDKIEQKNGRESIELEFEDGKVVKNFSEDRLQIIFDGKPNSDVISNLKHNGFRWSPRFGAWQRQLTSNAYYGASRVIPVTIEQLKTMR